MAGIHYTLDIFTNILEFYEVLVIWYRNKKFSTSIFWFAKIHWTRTVKIFELSNWIYYLRAVKTLGLSTCIHNLRYCTTKKWNGNNFLHRNWIGSLKLLNILDKIICVLLLWSQQKLIPSRYPTKFQFRRSSIIFLTNDPQSNQKSGQIS